MGKGGVEGKDIKWRCACIGVFGGSLFAICKKCLRASECVTQSVGSAGGGIAVAPSLPRVAVWVCVRMSVCVLKRETGNGGAGGTDMKGRCAGVCVCVGTLFAHSFTHKVCASEGVSLCGRKRTWWGEVRRFLV